MQHEGGDLQTMRCLIGFCQKKEDDALINVEVDFTCRNGVIVHGKEVADAVEMLGRDLTGWVRDTFEYGDDTVGNAERCKENRKRENDNMLAMMKGVSNTSIVSFTKTFNYIIRKESDAILQHPNHDEIRMDSRVVFSRKRNLSQASHFEDFVGEIQNQHIQFHCLTMLIPMEGAHASV